MPAKKNSIISKETLLPVGLVIVILVAVVGFSTGLTEVEAVAGNNKDDITEIKDDLDELEKEYYRAMISISKDISSINEALENLEK